MKMKENDKNRKKLVKSNFQKEKGKLRFAPCILVQYTISSLTFEKILIHPSHLLFLLLISPSRGMK